MSVLFELSNDPREEDQLYRPLGCCAPSYGFLVERREPFIWKSCPLGVHLLLGKVKLTGAWRNTGGFPHLTLLGSYDRFYVSLLGLLSFYIPQSCENFGHLCINLFIRYPGRLVFENGLPPKKNVIFYFVFAEWWWGF